MDAPVASLELLKRIERDCAEAATHTREILTLPPLQLSFHRTDDLIYLNYALPLSYLPGDVSPEVLQQARTAFAARNRRLRFEFFEALWPDLPAALESQGILFEARMPMMVCGRGNLRPARETGAAIDPLTPDAPDAGLIEYLAVWRAAFGMEDRPLRPGELDETRENLQKSVYRTMVARVNSRIAAIGSISCANHELVGVATLPPYRRRGLAAALSHALVQEHLATAEYAWLSAADQAARSVYERIGFHAAGNQLSYIAPAS